jgi:hypothetical protein
LSMRIDAVCGMFLGIVEVLKIVENLGVGLREKMGEEKPGG